MKQKEKEIIKIVIDENLLNLYYDSYYFIKYPKRRKRKIESPIIPSLNSWIILKRLQMNSLKQAWKEFGEWVIKFFGYENLKIDNCEIFFNYQFKNNRRRDPDNYVPKFFLDAMVSSSIIVDDSSNVIKQLHLSCQHGECDKMSIIIEY